MILDAWRKKELRAGGGLNVRETKGGETVEAPLNGYGDTEKPYWDWGE